MQYDGGMRVGVEAAMMEIPDRERCAVNEESVPLSRMNSYSGKICSAPAFSVL
jgi:hypothetical protein